MAEANIGMDKAELKKLLMLSKKQPVHCGLGMTKEGVVIKLDRMKQGRALTAEMQKTHKDFKNPVWGEAFVDMEEDPKLVVLSLNKAASGLAGKLRKSLKGTGFSKVEIRLEDGTVAEKLDDEEEGEEAADSRAPQTAAPASPAESAPPAATATAAPTTAESGTSAPQADATASPAAAATADAAALTRQLTDLVRRMAGALTADPSRAAALKALAVAAQARLKSGDSEGARTAIAALRRATEQSAGANGAASATQAGQPAPSPAIAKARQVWVATRQKVGSDLDKLHGTFTAAFNGHGRQAELTKAFRTRVDGVLGKLDDALAHKLDAVNTAANPTERAKLVQEAHTLIATYSKHVASDPTITEVDRNPFAPLELRKTITASLTALSKSIS